MLTPILNPSFPTNICSNFLTTRVLCAIYCVDGLLTLYCKPSKFTSSLSTITNSNKFATNFKPKSFVNARNLYSD